MRKIEKTSNDPKNYTWCEKATSQNKHESQHKGRFRKRIGSLDETQEKKTQRKNHTTYQNDDRRKSLEKKNGPTKAPEINKTDDEQVISRTQGRNNGKPELPPAADGGPLWTSRDLQVGRNDPIPSKSSRANKTTERTMDKICRTRFNHQRGVPREAPTSTPNRNGEDRRRSQTR